MTEGNRALKEEIIEAASDLAQLKEDRKGFSEPMLIIPSKWKKYLPIIKAALEAESQPSAQAALAKRLSVKCMNGLHQKGRYDPGCHGRRRTEAGEKGIFAVASCECDCHAKAKERPT